MSDYVVPGVTRSPEGGASRVLRLLTKAGWNLVDQVLSALTNAVLAVLVDRFAGSTGLAAFAVSFMIFSVLIGCSRALVGQPLGIRYSDASGAAWQRAKAQSFGVVVALSVPAGVGCIVVGMIFGGLLGPTLIATGVALPALILQDTCRMIFFARSEAKLAALNDGLWAVIQFTAIGLLAFFEMATAANLVLAWGGAAAICAAVGVRQLGALPHVGGTRAWLAQNRDLVGYLLAEYLLTTGAFQGGFLLVAGIVGEAILGALRAAQVLLGPLGIISAAMMSFALPEISRRRDMRPATRWRVAVAAGSLMVAISLLYTLLLLLMPTNVGELIFPNTWGAARSVLLPVALGSTAAGACLGPALAIFSMGMAKKTFRLMAFEAPLALICLLGGALLGGSTGAAWGLCLDQSLLVPLWYWQLHRILATSSIDTVDTVEEAEQQAH